MSRTPTSSNSPFVVAELSANHLGDLGRAKELVYAAYVAGADAIKLQTYRAETMVGDPHHALASGPWAGRLLVDLYREAATPWDWHPVLFETAHSLGMEAFSSVFDLEGLAFLESLEVPRYKVASFELTDTPLIRAVAETGKPVILSTGMGSAEEVRAAVEAAGRPTLLHCVSAYPAKAADARLRRMGALRIAYGCQVGLSDHTLSTAIPAAAAALGATVIEKHLTLSRADGGPDAGFSLDPGEFADMVRAVREVSQALGNRGAQAEQPQRALRRSLWATSDIRRGEPFTAENFDSRRLSGGLEPSLKQDILGRRASRDIARFTPIRADMIAG